jgi:hypothetical protein
VVKRLAHRLPQRVEATPDGRFVATDEVLGLPAYGATAGEADDALRALWKPKFDGMDDAELDAYLEQCEALEVDVEEEYLEQWRAEADRLRQAPPE